MTSFYESAAAITGENRIKTKEPLNRYTTFRIGGKADFIAEPEKPEQIAELADLCKKEKVPFFIMGNGSNLLVSDDGYHGMIIHIADGMSRITVEGTRITAQAGASLIKTAVTAKQHGLTGMEFASGIPGSVGGAVYMNAGAYGGEMKHIITSVKVLDQDIVATAKSEKPSVDKQVQDEVADAEKNGGEVNPEGWGESAHQHAVHWSDSGRSARDPAPGEGQEEGCGRRGAVCSILCADYRDADFPE